MGLAYIIPVNAAEGLYNVIAIGPGSAPPRPSPRPPYPDQGLPPVEGPVDPGYGFPVGGLRPSHDLPPFPSHPIVLPPDAVPPDLGLHPSHPIVIPPGSGGLPPGSGVIIPVPPGATPPPAPAGTPPENTQVYVLWFGKGTVASVVYLPPTATTKPV